jgi:hypothetical protein
MPKRSPRAKLFEWRVIKIRSTPARLIGYVQAADEQAVKEAIADRQSTGAGPAGRTAGERDRLELPRDGSSSTLKTDHIRYCRERAAECRRRADRAVARDVRAAYFDMERMWLTAAECEPDSPGGET